MSFLNKFFGKKPEKIECPICLGKGHVSWEDISRLKQELKWKPGTCAYCNGTGKVNPDILQNIPVETTYLSTGVSAREAKRLQNGDSNALERATLFDLEANRHIQEIKDLFRTKMSTSQIANYYFSKYPQFFNTDYKKKEFIDYVERVVVHVDD